MIGYVYTFDLGDDYGPKFEELADERSCDDREEFLKRLVCSAIDLAKALGRADDAALVLQLVVKGLPSTESDYRPDEDIPF